EKHLAGQAHSLMAGDQRHEFRTLGELISGAHERLVARMDLSERDAEQIQEQTRAVAHVGRSFPISRTETFFGEPEKTEKGAGLLFSITVNADACKACGLCSAVCPDEAMEMTQSTPDLVSQYRRDWRVAMQMPATTADRIERFVSDDQPGTTAYRLLDRRAYHATLGGDSGFPGSGTRATLHLVAGIADSIVRPRVDKFHSAVENTIERLQGVIRDYVQKTVDVNDFEEFGKRLKEIDSPLLDAQRLAGLTEGGDQVDRERLLQLNTALSELDEMRSRHEFHGKDSGTSMAAAFSLAQPGSNSARYPYNPFSFPWINVAPGTAPAVAEGLLEGIGRDLIQDLRTLRKARMILDDVYEPPSNGRADSLAWTDLTDEERDLCPPVCAVVANQNEVLPNLLSLELPVKIFVLDDGSLLEAKSPRLHLWPMARPDAFVMRSTLGMHEHLLSGLTKGLGTNRPALFHLYVAEPPVDGILADMTMETMRLAAESRAFPVMIYDPDRSDTWSDCWDLGGNPDEAEDWYLRNLGVQTTSGSSSRSMPFTVADWAVRMARYRRHFRHVPRNAWHGNMVPLSDFLSMEQEQRDGLQPFIEVSTDERTARIEVLPEMVAATAAALRSWRLLQELGAIESSLVERVASRLRDEFEQKTERMKKDMASDYAARLDSERQSFESRIHGRLTEELLALSGYGDDDDRARKRLLELVGVATEDGTESGGAAAATQEPGAIPN
ncbi:MAG: 4Fe-4S binding protein, partial [Rhodothermia bacterium]|nr:4Fe-4S binding protein [Rhodothermia bacterium]